MSLLEAELSHLATMDAALPTLTAAVRALDCGPAAVAALVTLTIATTEARLTITERLILWLDSHFEAQEARSVLATARAVLAGARLGVDVLPAAELRAAERLN